MSTSGEEVFIISKLNSVHYMQKSNFYYKYLYGARITLSDSSLYHWQKFLLSCVLKFPKIKVKKIEY